MALDAVLRTYGGLGAHGRRDQISHRYLSEEFKQLASMATLFPAIFLSVAAFLLNVVIGRLMATQRGQIAILKAFGYTTVDMVGSLSQVRGVIVRNRPRARSCRRSVARPWALEPIYGRLPVPLSRVLDQPAGRCHFRAGKSGRRWSRYLVRRDPLGPRVARRRDAAGAARQLSVEYLRAHRNRPMVLAADAHDLP